MSFNAIAIAKLGVGFGALAVAGIGLLARDSMDDDAPVKRGHGSSGRTIYRTVSRAEGDSDDDEMLIFALLA